MTFALVAAVGMAVEGTTMRGASRALKDFDAEEAAVKRSEGREDGYSVKLRFRHNKRKEAKQAKQEADDADREYEAEPTEEKRLNKEAKHAAKAAKDAEEKVAKKDLDDEAANQAMESKKSKRGEAEKNKKDKKKKDGDDEKEERDKDCECNPSTDEILLLSHNKCQETQLQYWSKGCGDHDEEKEEKEKKLKCTCDGAGETAVCPVGSKRWFHLECPAPCECPAAPELLNTVAWQERRMLEECTPEVAELICDTDHDPIIRCVGGGKGKIPCSGSEYVHDHNSHEHRDENGERSTKARIGGPAHGQKHDEQSPEFFVSCPGGAASCKVSRVGVPIHVTGQGVETEGVLKCGDVSFASAKGFAPRTVDKLKHLGGTEYSIFYNHWMDFSQSAATVPAGSQCSLSLSLSSSDVTTESEFSLRDDPECEGNCFSFHVSTD